MKSKTALVTGVTGGFGSAIARRLSRDGYDLILHARNREKLQALIPTLSRPPAGTLVFDIRHTDEMAVALKDIRPVDLLVNNAGLALGIDKAQNADAGDWDEMIATNITGLVHMTRHILPGMVRDGTGHIVNIGSVSGSWPYAGGSVYCATKSFVRQFSLALRSDLHGTGIRVTDIEPGMAETNFSVARFKGDTERAARVYAGVQPLTGDDIAEAVAWVASLPAHVNINSMEIMPTCQSVAGLQVYREQA